MTDREMYEALRREFLTLQRERAEVEVAYGKLRSRLHEAIRLCTCGALHEGSEGGLGELV
jgi:hypothetical protein